MHGKQSQLAVIIDKCIIWLDFYSHVLTWCSSISTTCSNVLLTKSWKFAVGFVNNGDAEVATALLVPVSS